MLFTTLTEILSVIVPGVSGHSVIGPAGGNTGQDSTQTDGRTEGHRHPALEAQSVRADRDQPGSDYVHMEDVWQKVRLLTLPTHCTVVSSVHCY